MTDTTAERGTCRLCGQEMIRTADDCWHPHTVAKACPPEPPSGADFDPAAWEAWRAAGNDHGRPGREYFVAGPVEIVAPVLTPGATPFNICVCATCGPPWRNERPRPAEDAPGLEKLAWGSWMALCPTCGNKRCPAAVDHTRECSGSNDPNQPHLTGWSG